jgi:hypothetical protein
MSRVPVQDGPCVGKGRLTGGLVRTLSARPITTPLIFFQKKSRSHTPFLLDFGLSWTAWTDSDISLQPPTASNHFTCVAPRRRRVAPAVKRLNGRFRDGAYRLVLPCSRESECDGQGLRLRC